MFQGFLFFLLPQEAYLFEPCYFLSRYARCSMMANIFFAYMVDIEALMTAEFLYKNYNCESDRMQLKS